jgi:aspartate kinase
MNDRVPVIVKYGGSAFKTADDFHRVAYHQRGLYESQKLPVAVNSARKGVSDRLLALWRTDSTLKDYAGEESEFYSEVFGGRGDKDAFMKDLNAGFERMMDVLEASSSRYPDTHRESYILSHGETETGVALQYLLSDFKAGIKFLDGHDAGVVASGMRGAVDIEKSIQNIRSRNGNSCYGGFVGRDPNNPDFYCLLDRNSTDVTAALVAAALGGGEYWNIKDVNGVFVCDPGVLDGSEKPKVISRLSYDEAANITRSGSPVIHPTGIIISRDHDVKIRITSLDNGGMGTIISEESGTTPDKPFAAISSGVYACVTVFDSAMDIPGGGRGYVHDVTGILKRLGYDILTPTGPGNAMSFVVAGGSEITKDRGVDVEHLVASLTEGLRGCGRDGQVRGREVGYIALTGKGMRNRVGTLRDVFSVVADEGISISLTSQVDEEEVETPVVSFCVNPGEYRRAVNALSRELF